MSNGKVVHTGNAEDILNDPHINEYFLGTKGISFLDTERASYNSRLIYILMFFVAFFWGLASLASWKNSCNRLVELSILSDVFKVYLCSSSLIWLALV